MGRDGRSRAGALVLAIVLALGVAHTAHAADNTSTVQGLIEPGQFPHDDFARGTLTLETTTMTTGDAGGPVFPTLFPYTRTRHLAIDLDDGMRYVTNGLDRCRRSLVASTTQFALNWCGSSRVGSGTANVCAYLAPDGCTNLTATITAFNGPPTPAGAPTIILHTRIGSVGLTRIITATVVESPLGGDYGRRIAMKIPQMLGMGAMTYARLTLRKRFLVGEGRRSLIQARCHDADLELNYSAAFEYADDDSDTVTDEQSCVVTA
jgi:hypothetical protein